MPPRNKDPRRAFGTIEIRNRDAKGRPSRFRPKYKVHGQPGYEMGPTLDSRARAEEWLHREEELLKFGRRTPVKARKAAERKEQALRATSLLSYAEEWIKTANLESTTRSTYGSIFKSRFEGFLDDATLRSFDAEAFKRWEVAVADAYPQTTARNRDAAELLRTIFNHAVKHGLIDASPVRISTKKEDSGFEKPIPSRQELEELTAAMPSHYRAAISTLATCGLRQGEMCELRVKDLRTDRETGRMTIHVDRQIQRVDGEFIIKKPKGNKRRRVLVL